MVKSTSVAALWIPRLGPFALTTTLVRSSKSKRKNVLSHAGTPARNEGCVQTEDRLNPSAIGS